VRDKQKRPKRSAAESGTTKKNVQVLVVINKDVYMSRVGAWGGVE